MGMRKKLVSLIREVTPYWAEVLSDYLMVNGVTIPVRCKNCKHYLYDDFDGAYVCMQLSEYVKPDFWCAHGERKDNETD